MVDSMSKKERLARGSAVIKVMKVIPRPGNFLKYYVDPYKLPRKPPVPGAAKNPAAEMPHLDVKNARFEFLPVSARVAVQYDMTAIEGGAGGGGGGDPCKIEVESDSDGNKKYGLPDGDKLLTWFGYREWAASVNPTYDANIAEHFNVLLGLLITMSEDPENENFPDVEAYPCVQFLRTIKTPDGFMPYNAASFVEYLEYVCLKILEES